MATDSELARPAAPRFPRAAWLGTLGLIGFGAATLVGLHGGSRVFAAVPEPPEQISEADAPDLTPVLPADETDETGEGEDGCDAGTSGRRRSGVTDPLWDNDVWYPGADSQPPASAPGGFHS